MNELSSVLLHRAPQLQQSRERHGEVVDHIDVLLVPRDPIAHSPRMGTPIKEVRPGHLPQGSMEGTAGTEHTADRRGRQHGVLRRTRG
ncbi:hypothetical protein [Streptomyces sp. NRRL F-5630]|uniref:hypothetical protein n=1 Tax=Streptomyces sp. NRRL F-5630 TaxID=1463864 RepID=UPI000AFF2EB4